MARILADLPEDDIKWLDVRAAEQGKSRASLLREAVAAFKAQAPGSGKKDWIDRGYGFWAGRSDIGDGVVYQQIMRDEPAAHDET